jgi:hypothetical protein
MNNPLGDLDRALRSLSGLLGRKPPRKPHECRSFNGITEHNGRWGGEMYWFRLRIPRGRREHHCAICGEDIPKGEQHVAATSRDQEGPGWECWRYHGECYLVGAPMFGDEGRPDWRWADGEDRPLTNPIASL